jgi:hypothetical protein
LDFLGKVVESDESVVTERLAEIKLKSPEDLSAQIVASVWGLRAKDPEQRKAAALELVSLVERTPLEEIPAGQRPTARQRGDASRQMWLWFAAREFLDKEPLREMGNRLAERAVLAAERQLDQGHALSFLQAWGSQAAALGDKPQAEARWSRMLDLLLASSRFESAPPEGSGENAPTAPASGPESTGFGRATTRPLTELQFAQVMNLAELTAMSAPELSLRAVRAALAGGPPVPNVGAPVANTPIPTTATGSGYVVTMSPSGSTVTTRSVTSTSRTSTRPDLRGNAVVVTAVQRVVSEWEKAGLPPEQISRALEAIVFCPARPQEILLYEMAITNWTTKAPQNLGGILCRATVAAGRVEDLKRDIAARQTNPAAQLSALVLLFQLNYAAGDRAAALENLQAITAFVDAKPTPSHINLASHVGLLTSSDPELYRIARLLVERAIKAWGGSMAR